MASNKISRVIRAVGVAALLIFLIFYFVNKHEQEEESKRLDELMRKGEEQMEQDRRAAETLREIRDVQLVIDAGGTQTVDFDLSYQTRVLVEMTPVRDVDKGISLSLVLAEDVNACLGRVEGQCRGVAAFNEPRVRATKHAETVPAGRWVLLVRNSENLINAATVRVHIVANPAQ